MRSRRYLAWWLGTVVTVLATVAGAIHVIDPYGRAAVARPGFNQRKPLLASATRLYKAELVARQAPAVLLVGNSRVMVGCDPASPALAAWPGARVNAAFGSATAYEVMRLVEHAAASGPLRLVVIGWDFDLFGAGQRWNEDFRDDRLAIAADGQPQPWAWTTDVTATRLSWSALDAARTTLSASRAGGDPLADPLTGYAADERAWTSWALHDGHRALVRANERTYLTAMRGWCDDSAQRARYARDLDYVRRTLDCAFAAGAEVRVFIGPVHARTRELWRVLGMEAAWRDWQRALVAAVDERRRAVGRPPLPVWDFSAPSAITTEAIPPAGDRQPMRWYWEASHYRRATGELVLARLAGDAPADGFGVALVPDRVDAHHAALAAARAAWLAEQPGEAAEVDALWAAITR